MKRAKSTPSQEIFIPIPTDRYQYFRDALRASTEARRELMEHLQILIERETERHQKAWNELVQLGGFRNIAHLHEQKKEMLVDWAHDRLMVRDKKA